MSCFRQAGKTSFFTPYTPALACVTANLQESSQVDRDKVKTVTLKFYSVIRNSFQYHKAAESVAGETKRNNVQLILTLMNHETL